jgi:hypothetical protein
MSTQPKPEAIIRRYLEDHEGSVEVPAHNLLTTWQRPRWTAGVKDAISTALAEAGIATDPPLAETKRDDLVRLQLVEDREGRANGGSETFQTPDTADTQAPDAGEPAPLDTPQAPQVGDSVPAPDGPAGWYPDYEDPGRSRYWDGRKWTGYVDSRELSELPMEPTPGRSPNSSSPYARPWWRRLLQRRR